MCHNRLGPQVHIELGLRVLRIRFCPANYCDD